jgi:uroporphyrinogen decarboxylase
MTKREVVVDALEFRPPAYVPWAWGMTQDCAELCRKHLGTDNLGGFLGSHFLDLGPDIGRFERVDAHHDRDMYGVVWDRSIDRDIGNPCDWPIKRPEDLAGYEWPDPADDEWYAGIPERMAAHPELFSRYQLGFSLYERAWTMRGMDSLLMDMVERPEFVEELLDAIVRHNLVQVHRALKLDVDAVYFGDDYGMQTGLIMGVEHWRHFIKPGLARMFAPVREAGKYVCMHSCGCVDVLFDDLVEIGLNMFNPFQPDVMDVFALMRQYHGRLAFHGGMSVQNTLPFGTVDEVRDMTQRLIEAGSEGGYIFSPSHSVPRDVAPENLVAMMDVLRAQPGYPGDGWEAGGNA